MAFITLQAARVNAGYTLSEVEELTHRTAKTLSSYERGKTAISKAFFEELCELYKIAPNLVFVPPVKDGEFDEE